MFVKCCRIWKHAQPAWLAALELSAQNIQQCCKQPLFLYEMCYNLVCFNCFVKQRLSQCPCHVYSLQTQLSVQKETFIFKCRGSASFSSTSDLNCQIQYLTKWCRNYVITVGLSLPVSFGRSDSVRATSTSFCSAGAVSWLRSCSLASAATYFSIYMRMVAPDEPVPAQIN